MCCLISLLARDVSAQGTLAPFIEVLPSGSVYLNADESTRLSDMKQSVNSTTLWHIRTNPIQNYLNGKQLTLQLPDEPQAITFTADYVSSKGSNTYSWVGYSQNESICQLYKLPQGFIGEIYSATSGMQYSIQEISAGKYTCIKYSSRVATSDCTLDSEDEEVDNTVSDRTYCPANNIRVLVLFTAGAAAIAVPTTVGAAIVAQLNTTTATSGLTPTQISFTLANVLLLSGFIESFNIITDVNDLADNATAQSLRNANTADVVLLLTTASQTNGVGRAKRTSASEKNAYCVVQIPTAVGLFTGSHEIGHVIGARHQRCGTCLGVGCDPLTSHHGFPVGATMRTIMYQNGCDTRARMARWSNPGAPFGMAPTGNSTNNNAAALVGRADDVSCFRSEPSPPTTISTVDLNGLTQICASSSFNHYTVTGNPFELVPPFTYLWEVSLNGISGWTTLSTSDQLALPTANIPLTSSGTLPASFFIRVTLSDFAGKTGSDQVEVSIANCLGGTDDRDALLENMDSKNIFYPNPIKDVLLLQPFAGAKRAIIFGVNGEKVQEITFNAGLDSETIDMSYLSAGTYFLQVTSESTTRTFKIVKL